MNRKKWIALVLVLGGACSDPVDAPRPLAIVTAGRAERGGEVVLSLLEGTDTVPRAQVTWTATPASAVQEIASGRYRLLAPGAVVVTARYTGRDATQTLTVVAPPLLILDLLRDGNRDLYAVALDGGDFRRITTSTADDRSPTVAGDRIVFASFRNGNGELYSIQLNGAPGSEVRLTQTAVEEANPALSPNGQRLAFERSAGGPSELWVAAMADLANAQLAALNSGGADALEGSPTWARNDLLVFLGTAFFDADLFTLTSPPAAPAELVRVPGPQVDPSASHDGTKVVYAAAIDNDLELHVVDIQSKQTRALVRRAGTDSRAVFLADGRIVFLAFDPAPMRVYWFDPAETTPILHEVPVGAGLVNQTKLAAVR